MKVVYDIYNYTPVPCVATIGSFDGVHCGHRAMLGELRASANEKGLPLMVITFARHPRLMFDGECEPFILTTNSEKLELLESAGADICVFLDFDSCMASMSARRFMEEVLVSRLGVQCLAVGYDHHFGKPCEGEGLPEYISYGKELGIEVFGAKPFEKNGRAISSSAVRRALEAGEAALATELLGHCYSLCGRVVQGEGIGRSLGFPTANILVDEPLKMVPANGVYEVAVQVGERNCKGVMNIGVRPTVGENLMRTLEVHLLDLEGNLYGADIKVELLRRLRGEHVFDNFEALRFQIEVDVARVRRGI